MNPALTDWILYVALGGLVLVAIAFAPRRFVLWTSRYVSPNWVSVASVPLAWIGYFCFYRKQEYLLAILFMCARGGFDRYDGRQAAFCDQAKGGANPPEGFWAQMNHRGSTPLGKSLDPGADKAAVTPIFVDVLMKMMQAGSFLAHVGAALIGIMLLADLCGQLLRLKVFSGWRRETDNGAQWPGKTKALVQWLWLGLFPVWEHRWVSAHDLYLVCLNLLLGGLAVLAWLSVLSKIRPLRPEWTRAFGHE